MAEGTLIDYAIRLHGIPMRWRTRMLQLGSAIWVHRRANQGSRSQMGHQQKRFPARSWQIAFAMPLAPLGGVAFPLVLLRTSEDFRVPGESNIEDFLK
jgi:hypothetical protein